MYIGIDYSISSPAMCYKINDKLKFVSVTTRKLTDIETDDIDISFIKYPEWKTYQERYDLLSDIFISYINQDDFVFIEDYSFGSTGLVFNLAENCGILKYKLYKNNINFKLLPPASIKKYATGRGNAGKPLMLQSFISDTRIEIDTIISGKTNNPASDIVDAYYVMNYGIYTLN